MRRERRGDGEKMNLGVEEAAVCRGGSREDRNCCSLSTLGDAGGQRLREGMVKQLQAPELGKKG